MTAHKWLITAAAIVVISLISALIWLQQATKPEKVIGRLTEAVSKEDPALLRGVLLPDDKKADVSEPAVMAMIHYLKENNGSFEAIKEGMQEQIAENDYSANGQQIHLVNEGKKWGLFPDYKLGVKTVSVKVSGLGEEDDLALSSGQLKKPLYKQDGQLFGPILPGLYEMRMKVSNQLGTFMDKEKLDAWGSQEVSLIADSVKLAREDKKVREDILSAVDIFNRDLSSFQASGFDMAKLTNAADEIKNDPAMERDRQLFEETKSYLEEIHTQYLGAVANMDKLDIHYFDGRWMAEVDAFVHFQNKVKIKGIKEFHEEPTKTIGSYTLVYDPKKKKWMIKSLQSIPATGSEVNDWKNTLEMKVSNPKVEVWSHKSQGDYL
ncbi:TcaA second domain-containing protein [Bacillus xiapuensis]|uniref:TcaA second domain-containing protein n=1 Tax=Bacillus xiapuensis TaxID=2014075 RepID=UPI000C2465AB|nr:hypothetical protein [Bacillus xiapuensis]